MNKTGICIKCGSGAIIRFDGSRREYGAGEYILTGKLGMSSVMVNRYVCTECGYIEEWVDKSDIPQLLKSKKARRKIGY